MAKIIETTHFWRGSRAVWHPVSGRTTSCDFETIRPRAPAPLPGASPAARLARSSANGPPLTEPTAVSDRSPNQRSRRHVHARVALILLETVRDRDRPGELLGDENVAITMPRRLGLSDVVEAQIQRYRQDTRRGHRIPEREIRDLIRLVSRRPDAESVLLDAGRSLTDPSNGRGWRKILPERLALDLARRKVRRRFRALFGGKFLSAPRGGFRLQAADDLLTEADPGGRACSLVTGLSQAVLEGYGSSGRKVTHASCRARGDGLCKWSLEEARVGDPAADGVMEPSASE